MPNGEIRLPNILSFGNLSEEITLEPLDIVVGQNASGKSNLVDAMKLLQSLSQDNSHRQNAESGLSQNRTRREDFRDY